MKLPKDFILSLLIPGLVWLLASVLITLALFRNVDVWNGIVYLLYCVVMAVVFGIPFALYLEYRNLIIAFFDSRPKRQPEIEEFYSKKKNCQEVAETESNDVEVEPETEEPTPVQKELLKRSTTFTDCIIAKDKTAALDMIKELSGNFAGVELFVVIKAAMKAGIITRPSHAQMLDLFDKRATSKTNYNRYFGGMCDNNISDEQMQPFVNKFANIQ